MATMTAPAGSGPFFTLTELAQRVGCVEQTLRRKVIDRGCPHTPVGDATFFVTDVFVEWLRDCQVFKNRAASLAMVEPSNN